MNDSKNSSPKRENPSVPAKDIMNWLTDREQPVGRKLLADIFNVERPTVHRWMHGERQPTGLYEIILIALIYGPKLANQDTNTELSSIDEDRLWKIGKARNLLRKLKIALGE